MFAGFLVFEIRPANLENVFRGTFRVKKRDLPAKSGTVGRAHVDIFLEVYSVQKSIAFQNTLHHGDSAVVPFGILRQIERNFRNHVKLDDLH